MSGRAALALALGVTASAAAIASAVVTTPDGASDPSAIVTCVDPPSSVVSDGCRRVRCESRRWLPGEAPAGSPCALRPAVRLATELPRGVSGTLRVTVTPAGARAPVWRSPDPMPPLPPGRYQLEAARPDGSWRCRMTLAFPKPRPETVFIPWREPKRIEGRVLDGAGRPRAAVPVHADAEVTAGWRCEGDPLQVASRDDGSFRLGVDPEVSTVIVAGGWDDPAGIAYAPAAPGIRLVPRPPHRATARVVDQDGRPVACRARLDLTDAIERRVAPEGEGHCDAAGRFTVGPFAAASATIDLRPVDALALRLSVAATPRAPLIDLGEVRVQRGATLRVVVRDDRRSPVAGAKVVAESRAGVVVTRRTRTGPDGIAVLTGLLESAPVVLSVEAKGFVRFGKRGVPSAADEEVALVPAEPVTGRVVDPSGHGVRATVRVSTVEGAPLETASTEDDGTFALDSLPDGIVVLRAEASGSISDAARVGDRSHEVILALEEVDDIDGTVRDASGAPVAGASVVLVRDTVGDPPEAGAIASTRSRGDGTFRLTAAGRAGAVVAATAPGFALARAVPSSSPLVLTLQPEARLLVTSRGAARVAIVDSTGISRARDVSGPSLLVDHLAPGPCLVSSGFRHDKRVDLAPGTTTEVELDPGARVSGTVSAGGRPCAQAVVALAVAGPGAIAVSGVVRTDLHGAYAIEGAAPGTYVLTAVAPEGRAERRIDVPEGGEPGADLEIVERNLRVVVRTARQGNPVAGASVLATPADAACTAFADSAGGDDEAGWALVASNGGCERAITGDDGVVTLPLAQGGPHRVSVSASAFAPWERALDAVDGTIDVVAELAPGGPPRVRVILDTTPPLLPGSLYCVHGVSSSSQAPVAGEGACETLPPGPAVISFRADEVAFARAAVEVPESGEVTVTLAVPRAGRLVVPLSPGQRSVRILDEQGTPWNMPYGLGWPRCGLEGGQDTPITYVCHELPPGTYVVDVDGRRRTPVPVRGGETATAY